MRQALAGQPFTAQFAKDGEEALRAIEGDAPRLIVISSVVPKVSTPELIRAIRNRNALASIPILLTVSGYNGKSPKQDAVRMGASDILPKPAPVQPPKATVEAPRPAAPPPPAEAKPRTQSTSDLDKLLS
ncbi:MAG TPA: response regulator, partial [Thermoanaerobaculia bacterium]|nr:response regulator [Thermoanaerobaculia bacterium]